MNNASELMRKSEEMDAASFRAISNAARENRLEQALVHAMEKSVGTYNETASWWAKYKTKWRDDVGEWARRGFNHADLELPFEPDYTFMRLEVVRYFENLGFNVFYGKTPDGLRPSRKLRLEWYESVDY